MKRYYWYYFSNINKKWKVVEVAYWQLKGIKASCWYNDTFPSMFLTVTNKINK